MDGNKRIAVLATLEFLNTNRFDLDLSPAEDAMTTLVQVASGHLTIEDVITWIRPRIRLSDDA